MAKDEVIKFRCTGAEKRMFEAAAAKHKLTLSEWFLAIGKEKTALGDKVYGIDKVYGTSPAAYLLPDMQELKAKTDVLLNEPSEHSVKSQKIVAQAMKRMVTAAKSQRKAGKKATAKQRKEVEKLVKPKRSAFKAKALKKEQAKVDKQLRDAEVPIKGGKGFWSNLKKK